MLHAPIAWTPRADTASCCWRTSLSAPRRMLPAEALSRRASSSAAVSAPGFSAVGSSATAARRATVVLRPAVQSSDNDARRCSAAECWRNPSVAKRETASVAPTAPQRVAPIPCHRSAPKAPRSMPAVTTVPTSGAARVVNAITPPAALPSSADAGPRSTSTRSTRERSRLESWLWPSGRVWGTPSTRIFIPRMPKFARAPAPRIERRWSSE